MSDRSEIRAFASIDLCDVLTDAIRKIAEAGDDRAVYLLAAIAFKQLSIIFPPPEGQGGDDAGLLSIVEAEQDRFLERLALKRGKWRTAKGIQKESSKNPSGIQAESKRKPRATITNTKTTIADAIEGAQGAQAHTSPVESSRGGRAPRPTMQPPTADEVRAYAEAQGLAVDAGQFTDYYTAQGWKIKNGLPLKDWRAAVRNWARRDATARPAISDTGADDAKFHNAGW